MENQSDISSLYKKYKEFKQGLTKEDSWELWLSLSNKAELRIYQIDQNSKKLSFRVYDDTPSVVVFENLIAFDFGGSSDKGIDPVGRIMEVTDYSFKDALILFMGWLGEDIEVKPPVLRYKAEKKSEIQPYKPAYIRRVISDRHIYKNEYEKLAKGLFRGTTEKEQKYAENILYIGYIPATEEYIDRIFIPEMDENGIPYGSYRYNRGAVKPVAKGLLRSNSKRILYGSHMLPKFKGSIIYSEGHSDTVVNLAKRYGCLTTGASTKKIGDNIGTLAGKKIYDFPDLDIAGMLGAMKRHIEIEDFNKNCLEEQKITHIIFWWADWFVSDKIYNKISLNQVEKQDPFASIVNDIVLSNNLAGISIKMLKKLQLEFCKKRGWDFESLNIEKWKVIYKKQYKNIGFDFIDFYESKKNQEKDKLISFLDSKVKY